MNSIKKTIELIQNSNQKFDLQECGIYTFINPYSYMLLRKSKVLDQFDKIFVDGISLVKLLHVFGIRTVRRSFDMTSLAPLVFETSISKNLTIYFLGSTQEDIENFIGTIRKTYPKLNIIGYRNGYFEDEEERTRTISDLLEKSPDVVIAGMGTPYQENFLIDLKKVGWNGKGFTCGGFIHQTAKEIDYYPSFFDKNNLRWFYRMIDEPKLIKRYFLQYPVSICLLLLDLGRYRKEK